MQELVIAYVAAHASQSEALGQLHKYTGIHYAHSRLGTWRNEVRPLPDAVRREMLKVVLPKLIAAHLGCDPDIRSDLYEAIFDVVA